jgi:hypothetical protein
MKMVKKCLIAIAVVALLAATVQAGDPANKKLEGDWPWTKTYSAVDICTIPVYLNVGHFVQILNCTDLEIKLVQVECGSSGDFPCYEDCETFNARANFKATFGANFTGSDMNIITDKSLSWPDGDTIDGDGVEHTLKLCMTAKKVKLWDTGGVTSGSPKVGTITITVKPQPESGGGGTFWP